MMRTCVTAAFFDTNMFIYAVDPRDAERAKRDAVRSLLAKRSVHLSTQVMMETFNVLIKKELVIREIAKAYIGRLSTYDVIRPAADDVLRALNYCERYGISHFDALLICAAERANTRVFYSEDLNHGQIYGRVKVCNPFIEDFLN